MHLIRSALLLGWWVGTLSGALGQRRPVDYIDPLIGANASRQQGSLSKTFPGVCLPFGMVQLSPDTDTAGDQTAGYSYHNTTIEGSSFTHMSGVGWHGDFGNVLVTPTRGPLRVVPGLEEQPGSGYRSRFQHETEVIKAGYYAVTLDDHGIRSELTATQRTGMLRFTFPGDSEVQNRVQIDLAHRIGGTSTRQYIRVIDESTFEGWMLCTPEGGGWGHGGGRVSYTLHFYGRFNVPCHRFGIWAADLAGVNRKESFSNQGSYRKHIEKPLPDPIPLKIQSPISKIQSPISNTPTPSNHSRLGFTKPNTPTGNHSTTSKPAIAPSTCDRRSEQRLFLAVEKSPEPYPCNRSANLR